MATFGSDSVCSSDTGEPLNDWFTVYGREMAACLECSFDHPNEYSSKLENSLANCNSFNLPTLTLCSEYCIDSVQFSSGDCSAVCDSVFSSLQVDADRTQWTADEYCMMLFRYFFTSSQCYYCSSQEDPAAEQKLLAYATQCNLFTGFPNEIDVCERTSSTPVTSTTTLTSVITTFLSTTTTTSTIISSSENAVTSLTPIVPTTTSTSHAVTSLSPISSTSEDEGPVVIVTATVIISSSRTTQTTMNTIVSSIKSGSSDQSSTSTTTWDQSILPTVRTSTLPADSTYTGIYTVTSGTEIIVYIPNPTRSSSLPPSTLETISSFSSTEEEGPVVTVIITKSSSRTTSQISSRSSINSTSLSTTFSTIISTSLTQGYNSTITTSSRIDGVPQETTTVECVTVTVDCPPGSDQTDTVTKTSPDGKTVSVILPKTITTTVCETGKGCNDKKKTITKTCTETKCQTTDDDGNVNPTDDGNNPINSGDSQPTNDGGNSDDSGDNKPTGKDENPNENSIHTTTPTSVKPDENETTTHDNSPITSPPDASKLTTTLACEDDKDCTVTVTETCSVECEKQSGTITVTAPNGKTVTVIIPKSITVTIPQAKPTDTNVLPSATLSNDNNSTMPTDIKPNPNEPSGPLDQVNSGNTSSSVFYTIVLTQLLIVMGLLF